MDSYTLDNISYWLEFSLPYTTISMAIVFAKQYYIVLVVASKFSH